MLLMADAAAQRAASEQRLMPRCFVCRYAMLLREAQRAAATVRGSAQIKRAKGVIECDECARRAVDVTLRAARTLPCYVTLLP